MKIKLHSTDSFTEIGNRENNEDNLFPLVSESSINDTLFLVCDGVGGLYGGEIASALACEYIPIYFQQNSVASIDTQYVEQAISYARQAIKEEQQKRSMFGMSTTLTLLHFGDKGATVAHLGDSRIYHLRNGKIIWQSDDHSYVNSLLKTGMITKEESRTHPRRNQITRCLNGDEEDSNDKPEITQITDLRDSDYFFMCSDGVLEQIYYDELLEFFIYSDSFNSNSERLEAIREKCYGKTQDNFTAYLIQVETVENDTDFYPSRLFQDQEANSTNNKKNYLLPIFTSIFTLLITSLGYFWIKYRPNQNDVIISNPKKYKAIIHNITQKEKLNLSEVNTEKAIYEVLNDKKKRLRIPFGDNIILEVIDENNTNRFRNNKLLDKGTSHIGNGYVYYKPNGQSDCILYLQKPNRKLHLTQIPLQIENHLKILRKGSKILETINIMSGEIENSTNFQID